MIKIERKNGEAYIYTPYISKFVQSIKKIGGAKWNGEKKCWVIPEEFIEVARNLMMEVYGYTDISQNETVALKITFNEEVAERRSDVVLFTKIISHAYGRDSGAKVGDDVALQSGSVYSGGSVNNWNSVVEKGTIVILKNVNKNIYKKEKDRILEKYDLTIEEIENSVSKQTLIDEKNRLLARIKEIDKLLKSE